MEKKILVYDNQSAYFELLKEIFLNSYEFVLINSNSRLKVDLEYDMVLFFVYDEIELLDFIKLYIEEIPFVLGISNNAAAKNFTDYGNIQFLNLLKLKDELISDISRLLEERFSYKKTR